MSVAVDNSILTLFLNPGSKAKPNPDTGQETLHLEDRILSLMESLSKQREVLIVPAPALAESLCKASRSDAIDKKISQYSCIEIYPFDRKSAIEYAKILRANKGSIKTIQKSENSQWQAVKVDLQIVAIARAYGASAMYTDDGPQSSLCTLIGIDVKHSWDLPLSPERAQLLLGRDDEWTRVQNKTKQNDPGEPHAS